LLGLELGLVLGLELVYGPGLGLVMTVQFITVQIRQVTTVQQPHFLAHVYCGQPAGRIKMPFGMEVGLGPGHTVLDGKPAPP